MAKYVFDPFKRPRHYRHYAVGMKANDSTIVRITYPEGTKPKLREHVSRNCEHMDIHLLDGRVISSKDLILQTEEAFNNEQN